MLIEYIFPEVVLSKRPLKDCLIDSMAAQGLPPALIDTRLRLIPSPLINAHAFLDKMTNLWRYEFGEPYELNGQLMFGVHMWLSVEHLRIALNAALIHIPAVKQAPYFARLADPIKHWETLSEMMPAARLNKQAITDFEVSGLGNGNRTVDWAIELNERKIILDVKSRFADLLKLSLRKDVSGITPEPDHDPSLLFRNLENKFLCADPDTVLQGAWIMTHIVQNRSLTEQSFLALDAGRIHFAIFGDWEADVHILARRKQDKKFLLDVFTAFESSRFTYED
jgi:hypothetical protein